MYDFYTSPRPEDERTHPDHHTSEMIVFEESTPCESAESNESSQQKESSQRENAYPLTEPFCSHADIEINNKYGDTEQEIMKTNSGGVSACAEPPLLTGERVIVIPSPKRKPMWGF